METLELGHGHRFQVGAALGAAGARLRLGAAEQQQVRNVFAAAGALLRQVIRPAQQLQQRPDQLLLGLRLIRGPVAAKPRKHPPRPIPKRGECRPLATPLRRKPNPVAEKILRKKLSGHAAGQASYAGFLPPCGASSQHRTLAAAAKSQVLSDAWRFLAAAPGLCGCSSYSSLPPSG